MMAVPSRREMRQKTRFEIWAWSPVIVLRVALVITYLLYVYASLIAFIAGVPIFDLTTWEGYTPVWAILLGVSAGIAAVGSIADRYATVEKWASLVLTGMLLAYVGGLNLVGWADHDLGRQFVGAISLIASVLPATRFAWLAAQSGKKHVDN